MNDDYTVEISVLMCVYNTKEQYLREAIESILNQSFANFEFVIVDDGSDEYTKNVLKSYQDERIKIIYNEKNVGLTKSLNVGLSQTKGRYIARMDSDDVSYPNRLELQRKYLLCNTDVAAVGCWTVTNGVVKKWNGTVPYQWRKTRLLFDNSGIAHPSAFIDKKFLDDHLIKYSENILKAQDYDLWSQILQVGKVEVCPCALLMLRSHEEQISSKSKPEQDYYTNKVREKMLNRICSEMKENDKKTFLDFDNGQALPADIVRVFDLIQKGNAVSKIFDSRILKYEMVRMWSTKCFKHYLNGQYSRDAIWNRYTWGNFSIGYIMYRLVNSIQKIDLRKSM